MLHQNKFTGMGAFISNIRFNTLVRVAGHDYNYYLIGALKVGFKGCDARAFLALIWMEERV